MDIPILYNYKPFPSYKLGLFNIHTDVYKLPGGWVQKQEEYLIIGEDDTAYITKLQESTQGEWIGDKVVESTFILPLGIHKSRLIKWMPILELNT